MAFADYLDLRTAVIEQTGRVDITDVFDRLTKLAEARLGRTLRMAQQVSETTVTFSDGSATLPNDFQEVIGLYDANGREINQLTRQDLAGDQSRDGDYTLQYYAKIPSLTTGLTSTNWLLEAYPDVYLYSVAYEAARHARDTETAAVMKQLERECIMDARTNDYRIRYSRSRVRVRGVTP